MSSIVPYPVKIHFPNCKCNHYRARILNKKLILVSPYVKDNFKNRFFIYETKEQFIKDADRFVDNCLCTYSDGVYNGGVILLSDNPQSCIFNKTDELFNIHFEQLNNLVDVTDNSMLINKFCKLFPNLMQYFVLIGYTSKFDMMGNYISYNNCTFPKGKISYCDKTIDECCYREFKEETNMEITKDIIDMQIKIRKDKNLLFIPLEVVIDNFLLKIIIV